MPLMPFSEPSHVQKLLNGEKRQTTRRPRKVPLKVGDVLYCYYKPRHKSNCDNCIHYSNEDSDCIRLSKSVDTKGCGYWANYFGEAMVTKVLHYRDNSFGEYSNGVACDLFKNQTEQYMDVWAKADGFGGLQEAHRWFVKRYKNPAWMFQDWDVILFEPKWVPKEHCEYIAGYPRTWEE